MEILTIFLILGMIVIFGGALYLIFGLRRKHETEKIEAAFAAGFSRAEGELEQIKGRIYRLYKHKGGVKLKISYVWQKSFPDGKLVLFDLEDTSGESSMQLADQDVLVISSYLQLPRFTLMPRLQLPENAAGLGGRILSWAASMSAGKHMDSLGNAAFDAQYWVSTESPEAVRAFLTPDRLERLARLPGMRVEAAADMFSLAPAPYAQLRWDGQRPEPLTPNQKVQQTMQLFQTLAGPVGSNME